VADFRREYAGFRLDEQVWDPSFSWAEFRTMLDGLSGQSRVADMYKAAQYKLDYPDGIGGSRASGTVHYGPTITAANASSALRGAFGAK
jgi:hypothetical protein